jgi:phosphoserine aminotransferase
MKTVYFTVGPSQIYPTINSHIKNAMKKQIGSLSHRGKDFEEIFSGMTNSLKTLWNIPPEYSVFFVTSATEVMERIIENTVKKESFHFVNGSFAKRFFDIAEELGKQPKKVEVELGKGFDFAKIKIPKSTELLCFTQNETSTGVMLPAEEIESFKKLYPEKLIAIDTVSSAPYPDIDFTLTDIVFFSVQKVFGMPAGLGVMIVSPKSIEKSMFLQKKGMNIGSFHNFPTLKKWADKNQTIETPPVLEMYIFWKVLQDLEKIGIENLRKQIDVKADLLYDFFDNHPVWSTFVTDKTFRSPTVIVANIGAQQKKLKEYLQTNGMIVGSGYGQNKDTQIRIANFPALTLETIEKLLELLHNYK